MIPPGLVRSTGIPPIYRKKAPKPKYLNTVCLPMKVIFASRPAIAAIPRIPSQLEV